MYSTTKKMKELIDRPQFDQFNLCLCNSTNSSNSDQKQFYYVVISGIK